MLKLAQDNWRAAAVIAAAATVIGLFVGIALGVVAGTRYTIDGDWLANLVGAAIGAGLTFTLATGWSLRERNRASNDRRHNLLRLCTEAAMTLQGLRSMGNSPTTRAVFMKRLKITLAALVDLRLRGDQDSTEVALTLFELSWIADAEVEKISTQLDHRDVNPDDPGGPYELAYACGNLSRIVEDLRAALNDRSRIARFDGYARQVKAAAIV